MTTEPSQKKPYDSWETARNIHDGTTKEILRAAKEIRRKVKRDMKMLKKHGFL